MSPAEQLRFRCVELALQMRPANSNDLIRHAQIIQMFVSERPGVMVRLSGAMPPADDD